MGKLVMEYVHRQRHRAVPYFSQTVDIPRAGYPDNGRSARFQPSPLEPQLSPAAKRLQSQPQTANLTQNKPTKDIPSVTISYLPDTQDDLSILEKSRRKELTQTSAVANCFQTAASADNITHLLKGKSLGVGIDFEESGLKHTTRHCPNEQSKASSCTDVNKSSLTSKSASFGSSDFKAGQENFNSSAIKASNESIVSRERSCQTRCLTVPSPTLPRANSYNFCNSFNRSRSSLGNFSEYSGKYRLYPWFTPTLSASSSKTLSDSCLNESPSSMTLGDAFSRTPSGPMGKPESHSSRDSNKCFLQVPTEDFMSRFYIDRWRDDSRLTSSSGLASPMSTDDELYHDDKRTVRYREFLTSTPNSASSPNSPSTSPFIASTPPHWFHISKTARRFPGDTDSSMEFVSRASETDHAALSPVPSLLSDPCSPGSNLGENFSYPRKPSDRASSHLTDGPSPAMPVFLEGEERQNYKSRKVTSPLVCRWKTCGQQFLTQQDLASHVNDDHVRIERPDVDFQCQWQGCPRQGKGFNARYKMLIHIRTHTNEKPHGCSVCNKSFSRLENLKIHMRSHTGEKPYVCMFPGCHKAYSNSSDRFKHVRTHQEDKPYKCKMPGCRKQYTDPSSLRKHVRTHGHAIGTESLLVRRTVSAEERKCSRGNVPGETVRRHSSDLSSHDTRQQALCGLDGHPEGLYSHQENLSIQKSIELYKSMEFKDGVHQITSSKWLQDRNEREESSPNSITLTSEIPSERNGHDKSQSSTFESSKSFDVPSIVIEPAPKDDVENSLSRDRHLQNLNRPLDYPSSQLNVESKMSNKSEFVKPSGDDNEKSESEVSYSSFAAEKSKDSENIIVDVETVNEKGGNTNNSQESVTQSKTSAVKTPSPSHVSHWKKRNIWRREQEMASPLRSESSNQTITSSNSQSSVAPQSPKAFERNDALSSEQTHSNQSKATATQEGHLPQLKYPSRYEPESTVAHSEAKRIKLSEEAPLSSQATSHAQPPELNHPHSASWMGNSSALLCAMPALPFSLTSSSSNLGFETSDKSLYTKPAAAEPATYPPQTKALLAEYPRVSGAGPVSEELTATSRLAVYDLHPLFLSQRSDIWERFHPFLPAVSPLGPIAPHAIPALTSHAHAQLLRPSGFQIYPDIPIDVTSIYQLNPGHPWHGFAPASLPTTLHY